MRRIAAALLVAMTCATANMTSAQAARTPDRLVVTLRPTAGERVTWTLACHPAGGTHPNARRACRALDAMPHALVVTPNNLMCTQIWSGPERARVRGTWRGRDVDMSFSRSDGCATATWTRYAPLFTDPRTVLVSGSVDLGPTCPVQQVGEDCTTHGAAATVTATSTGRTRTTTSGSDGFRLRLPAGTWQVTADAGMHCDTVDVVVRVGPPPPPILITCDTGIR